MILATKNTMGSDMLATFGKRLRVLRNEQGLTQGDLIDILERRYGVTVGRSYISILEGGEKMPSGEIVAAMARALKTTSDYLLLLSDNPIYVEDGVTVSADDPAEVQLLEDLLRVAQELPRGDQEFALSFLRRLRSSAMGA